MINKKLVENIIFNKICILLYPKNALVTTYSEKRDFAVFPVVFFFKIAALAHAHQDIILKHCNYQNNFADFSLRPYCLFIFVNVLATTPVPCTPNACKKKCLDFPYHVYSDGMCNLGVCRCTTKFPIKGK